MVFVVLGTQNFGFERLLKEIERLKQKGLIKDKIIVQAGVTKFISKDLEVFDFVNRDDFEKYMEECDYVICHGGIGTILTALTKGKKVIAVARLKKYNEHVNDHQLDIINIFNEKSYILGCKDVSELENNIKKLKNFKANKYVSNQDKFVKLIEGLIEK